MKVILSLLLPLLFTAAVFLIIYAIILFAKAKRSGAKHLRKRALILIVLSSIYIVISLSYFSFKSKNFRKEVLQEISGRYIYSTGITDASTAELILNADHRFKFSNSQYRDSLIMGKWLLQNDNRHIQFYDRKGRLIWRSLWTSNTNAITLIIENGSSNLNFIKIK
jgi:hypothetical protein